MRKNDDQTTVKPSLILKGGDNLLAN